MPFIQQNHALIDKISFTPLTNLVLLDFYSDNDFYSVRDKTILIMFFDTGVRMSELLTLTDDRIFDNHMLIHGKGNKERIVPKNPILAKWILKYMRVRNSHFGYDKFEATFVNRYGKPLSKSYISKLVKDAGAFAKVGNDIRISPHTLRHTFAQQQLKNGLDIYSLSRIMGHENINITQRYLAGMRDKEIIESAVTTSTVMNL